MGMSIFDIVLAQLIDPFRVGMIAMLVLTTARTSGAVGTLVPLALGVVFIAALIPMSLTTEGDRMTLMAVGLVSNLIILGVGLALLAAYTRLTQSKG